MLLGVEDDGAVSGTTRSNLDEWVAELCRAKIEPPVIPVLSWPRDAEPGRHVLAVRVPLGPNKPYARIHDNRKTYYVRVGKTSREASREELERMFQASGRLHYGLKPVPGADFGALDLRRLKDYFVRVTRGTAPNDADVLGWETLLRNVNLMTTAATGQDVASVDGLLLFGRAPGRFLPQSGIRAICYPGEEPDYATRADEDIRGPMVPLGADDSLLESGVVDRAWDFVRRNTTPTARLEGPRRVDRWDFPEEVVREARGNALVHRDYSIAGTDIMLTIYADRLEIASPGRLPNTVTPEGMKVGVRYVCNQTLVNVMRDYGYVDAPRHGGPEKDHPRNAQTQRDRARPDRGRTPLHRPAVEGSEIRLIPSQRTVAEVALPMTVGKPRRSTESEEPP